MKKSILHIVWTVAFLCQSSSSFSQSNPIPKASVDRNHILVGEPIQLSLEIDLPAGTSPEWFQLDTIPHFEFIRKGNLDSVATATGKTYKQLVTITSFDSGRVLIPALSISIANKKLYTDSIAIDVAFSSFDAKQDYHDIKDIIVVDNPYTRYIVWIVLVVTLLSVSLVIYFVRKRQDPITETETPVSRLTPLEEAVQALEALKKQRLAENGQVKLYYTRLNDILRLFVLRRLRVETMEKTNEELILQLRQTSISASAFSQLTEALRMSDFVKFAKYLPGEQDNERNFKVIETSVQLLNETEE